MAHREYTETERNLIRRWYRPRRRGYGRRDLVRRFAEAAEVDAEVNPRTETSLQTHMGVPVFREAYRPHFTSAPGQLDPSVPFDYGDPIDDASLGDPSIPAPDDDGVAPPVDLSFCLVDPITYDAEADVYEVAAKSAPGGRLRLPGELHRELLHRYSRAKGGASTLNECARWLHWRRPWVRDYLAACEMTHDREPWTREQLAAAAGGELPTGALVEDVLERQRAIEAQRLVAAREAQDRRDAAAYRNLSASVVEPLREWIAEHAPRYTPPAVDIRDTDRPWTLVCALSDIHHGMRADQAVTPEPWDMDRSRRTLLHHVDHLIAQASRHGAPDRVVLGLRGDWHHCDTASGTTTKGTPLDVDGSPLTAVRDGLLLSVEAVDRFRALGCPVDVVGMGSSNHDLMVSALGLSHLEAWFWSAMDVTVSTDLHPRTYVEIGRTLYGFGHGEERDEDLPELMATEAPEAWARCPFRAFVVGHLHHERTKRSRIEAHGLRGVTVYRMGTMVPPDGWAHGKGYEAPRYLAAHVVDHETGTASAILSPVPPPRSAA